MNKLHAHSDKSCCDGKVDSPQVTENKYSDPACGMQAKADLSKSVEHSDITYFFSSQHCRVKFRANPQQYLKPQSTSASVAPQAKNIVITKN